VVVERYSEPFYQTNIKFLAQLIIEYLWRVYVKRHDVTTPDCSIIDRHNVSELPTTCAGLFLVWGILIAALAWVMEKQETT